MGSPLALDDNSGVFHLHLLLFLSGDTDPKIVAY